MIANSAQVRETGNLPESLKDQQIDPHLRAAKLRLRRWVGATVYDAAEADAATYTLAQTQDLQDAEAYLAISIGLRSWNMVMQAVGQKGAAGITDTGIVGENSYHYMTQTAINQAEASYLQKAQEAAREWLDSDFGGGTPGPDLVFAKDDEGKVMDNDYYSNQ